MSNDSPNTPVPRDRREAVREKAQQVHVRQSRARLARRVSLVVGVVAVVAAVAVVVTWTVSSAVNRPQLSPTNVTDDGFAITEKGRPFLRTVAARFDAYLPANKARP